MDQTREYTGQNAWGLAWSDVREMGHPTVANINGHMYKLYPSGHVLCAASRPFHLLKDGACDCLARKSAGTIAAYRFRF